MLPIQSCLLPFLALLHSLPTHPTDWVGDRCYSEVSSTASNSFQIFALHFFAKNFQIRNYRNLSKLIQVWGLTPTGKFSLVCSELNYDEFKMI